MEGISEDLCKWDTKDQVGVAKLSLGSTKRSNCFGGKPLRRIGVEVRLKEFKNYIIRQQM